MNDEDMERIASLVESTPDATYPEIQWAFNQHRNETASYAVGVRAVLKLGYTRKKRHRLHRSVTPVASKAFDINTDG